MWSYSFKYYCSSRICGTNYIKSICLQEELESEESSFREDDDTDDMDHAEEQEERSEKKLSRTQSRALLTPTQPVSKMFVQNVFL